MDYIVPQIKKGNPNTVMKLNQALRHLNEIYRITGDGIIRVIRSPSGCTLSLDISQLLSRIPKTPGGGGSGVTWARVVRGLQYADPDGDPPAGYGQYKLVPLSATEYDSATAFVVGDVTYLVTTVDEVDELRVYTCRQDCQGERPPNAAYWLADTEIQPFAVGVEGGYSATNSDMRDFVRWYHVGDIVPLYIRVGIYYFAQEMSPVVNSDDEGSVRWNEDEQRLMAVYR